MSDEAIAWLRGQIEGDKRAAGKARGKTGRWWRRTWRPYLNSDVIESHGALLEGDPEVDDPEHDIFIADVVIYDEGRPSDAEFAHIALHDPRDVVADCEAKLALLDVHVPVQDGTRVTCKVCVTWEDDPFDGETEFGIALPVAWPCMTLEITAAGYRHRDGYAERWDAQACPSCGKPDVVLPLGHSLAIPMDGSAPACDVIPDPGPDIITRFLGRRRS